MQKDFIRAWLIRLVLLDTVSQPIAHLLRIAVLSRNGVFR